MKSGTVLASSSPGKKTGFWETGQRANASVEQFQQFFFFFFFSTIAIFVTFIGDYTVRFAMQFKKENAVKVRKTVVSPRFPHPLIGIKNM